MDAIGWTTPQSGGSQKLVKNRATRTTRQACISIFPDGSTKVFREAAGASRTRNNGPKTVKVTVQTHAQRRQMIDHAIMQGIANQNYESGE